VSGGITSDNLHLSRPKPVLVHASAVDCTCLPEAVASYVRDSLAENTRRAYQSDLRHFEMWGGSLPASPKTVAAYLSDRRASGGAHLRLQGMWSRIYGKRATGRVARDLNLLAFKMALGSTLRRRDSR
jgi:hypothetical protein